MGVELRNIGSAIGSCSVLYNHWYDATSIGFRRYWADDLTGALKNAIGKPRPDLIAR